MKVIYWFLLIFVFVLKVNGQTSTQNELNLLCKFDKFYRDNTNFRSPNECDKLPYLMAETRSLNQGYSHQCIAIDNRLFQYQTLEIEFYADRGVSIQNFQQNNIASVSLPVITIFPVPGSDIVPRIRAIRLNGENVCSLSDLPTNAVHHSDIPYLKYLSFTGYLNKCQASIDRMNSAGTQCDNADGITVKKIRFTDGKNFYCIIIDRRRRVAVRQWDELYIRREPGTKINAIWSGDNLMTSGRSRNWESVEFHITSDQFVFVFNTQNSEHPQIQVRLNDDYPDTCGIMVGFDSLDYDDTCGARKVDVVVKSQIVFGATVYHGQYPWHTAIYLQLDDTNVDPNYKYICGGSIVSTNFIVTAAHCVKTVESTTPPQKLRVQVGKYYLSAHSLNTKEFGVVEVIAYPSYEPNFYENDIAILKLDDSIEYTNYIQPICLNDNNEHTIRNGESGFVPGWGKNENRVPNTVLRHAGMEIVSKQVCRASKREFFSDYLNEHNFCAGFRNSTTTCDGDSGGGLVFEIEGRWYLKGIVSVGVGTNVATAVHGGPSEMSCDFLQYALFTDVPNFVDWIRSKISGSN